MAETEEDAGPEIKKEAVSEIREEIGEETGAGAAAAGTEITVDARAEAEDGVKLQRHSEAAFGSTAPAVNSLLESFRAVAAEAGDYSRRSLENGSTFLQKLIGAASFESVIQIQSEYAKISYVGFLAHVVKLGQLYSNFARLAFKPLESTIVKAPTGNG